jgi:hypothetical protein
MPSALLRRQLPISRNWSEWKSHITLYGHAHVKALSSYSQFQISDGVGGDAQAQANAVFVDPFANTDLTTVSSDVLEAMNNMREAAESAETDDFDPQIAAASGATADALQVGKIKNKVLKLTGEVQVFNIKVCHAEFFVGVS